MKRLSFGTVVTLSVATTLVTIGYFTLLETSRKSEQLPTSATPIAEWATFHDVRAQYTVGYPEGWVLDQFENGIAVHPTGSAEPLWGVWFESDDSVWGGQLTTELGIEAARDRFGKTAAVAQTSTTVGGTPAMSIRVWEKTEPQQTIEFTTIEHHNVRFRIWNGSGPHPSFEQFVEGFTPLITGLAGLPDEYDRTGCEFNADCGLIAGAASEGADCLNLKRMGASFSTGTEESLGRSCTTCTNVDCGAKLPARSWCRCSAVGRCERAELGRYGLAWMCGRRERFTYQAYRSLESAFVRPCTLLYSGKRVYSGVAYSAEQAAYRARASYRSLAPFHLDYASGDRTDQFFTGWGTDTFVRYRTTANRYPRSGWYIDSNTVGSSVGSYFLSNDGYLEAYGDFNSLSGCY